MGCNYHSSMPSPLLPDPIKSSVMCLLSILNQ